MSKITKIINESSRKNYGLLKELKEPSVIYGTNPEDPNNPEVLVKGVGRYRLNTLVHDVQQKLSDLGQRGVRADNHEDWKRVDWMLNHDAMREMIRTIISAKKELGGIKESWGGMEIDGYKLDQEEQHEEDNVKIFHSVIDPSGKREVLSHTPYEFLDKSDFAKYVNYHKKHGSWPKHPKYTNWDKESLHQLLEGSMFNLLRGKRSSFKEDELKIQLKRLGEFVAKREKELQVANEKIKELQNIIDQDVVDQAPDLDPYADSEMTGGREG